MSKAQRLESPIVTLRLKLTPELMACLAAEASRTPFSQQTIIRKLLDRHYGMLTTDPDDCFAVEGRKLWTEPFGVAEKDVT